MKSIFLICSRVKIPNARVILLFGLFFYALPSKGNTIVVPVNDDCANATALTVNAATINGTLSGATNQNITGLYNFYSGKNDVWYSFTATCTTHIITVDYTNNPGSNIYFETYSGSCSSLSLVIGTYTTTSTYTIRQVTGLSIGTTYFIRIIDDKPGATTFSIKMTLDFPPISTSAATIITGSAATLNGSIASIPCTVVSKGFFYAPTGMNSNPQYNGTGVILLSVTGNVAGSYSSNISGLTRGIGYSVRAYTYDGVYYNYANVQTFTTLNQSSIADLSSLVVSSGTLSPSFTSTTTSYSATVTNATASITVTPTRLDANAIIQIQLNGGLYSGVVSGSASSPLPLNVGSNTINLKVTAQDGTIKIYTLTVCRAVIPSVTIFPSANPICSGTSVTFMPTPTNGGTPTYQWQKGGTNIIGATGTTYSSSGISNNDAISVIMTSNAICVSPATATSNTVTMLVNTLPIVSTPLKVDDRCQVGAGSISLSVSGGSPIYTVAGCGTTISPSPTVGQTVTLSNKTISTSGGTTTFSSLSGNITYKFTVTDANGCVAQ